jgi:hypothetical protein
LEPHFGKNVRPSAKNTNYQPSSRTPLGWAPGGSCGLHHRLCQLSLPLLARSMLCLLKPSPHRGDTACGSDQHLLGRRTQRINRSTAVCKPLMARTGVSFPSLCYLSRLLGKKVGAAPARAIAWYKAQAAATGGFAGGPALLAVGITGAGLLSMFVPPRVIPEPDIGRPADTSWLRDRFRWLTARK